MRRRYYLVEKSQFVKSVDIIQVRGHYEGLVDGKFVVSGDTWNEVYNDLQEMRYLR